MLIWQASYFSIMIHTGKIREFIWKQHPFGIMIVYTIGVKAACRLFLRGVIFTRARVSLALLSLRKNGGLLVVYPFKSKEMSISPTAETLWFLVKYSIFAICLQRWCEQRNYVWQCFREERWAVKRLFRFCSRVWKYLLSKEFISLYIWVK